MKKKIIVTAVIIALLILLFPLIYRYKDGGTIEYKALVYQVYDVHTLHGEGYDEGIIIKILGLEIFNNVQHYE